MKLVSVNVAHPREVTYRERTYRTAIYKVPVAGRVRVARLNIDGDSQGNPVTHGGPDMAVYVYGLEHYAHWTRDLGRVALGYGAFGENLTVTGMPERETAIGDVFRIGSARFQVTEPRTPCHKLAMKFADDDLPRRFALSGRVGFYFRVLEEGLIAADDEIACVDRDPARFTVAEALALWFDKAAGADQLDRALAVAALSQSWRERFARRRAALGGEAGETGKMRWNKSRLTWA